jgi:hypothetical protein
VLVLCQRPAELPSVCTLRDPAGNVLTSGLASSPAHQAVEHYKGAQTIDCIFLAMGCTTMAAS